MERRLAGRRIAVTRGKRDEDPLSARLRELGADVIEVPSISVAPPASLEDLDGALRDAGRFDWVVFASANAVERTLARAAELGVPAASLARPRLAAVGKATAARLEALLRAPDLVPAETRGESLAAALAPLVRGRRVLVPRAEEARPELLAGLSAAGAEVAAPVAYRTVPASAEVFRELGDRLERGEIDAVAFASPSAVKAAVAGLGPRAGLLARTAIAVIGPTTADAARSAGLSVAAQPAEATAAALADAIAARLGR